MRKSQKMDDYFAVFNITDVERAKAKEMLVSVFGEKLYDETIQKYDNKGIMTIFHKAPNKYTLWWVTTVSGLVRQRMNYTDPQGAIIPIKFEYAEKKPRKAA